MATVPERRSHDSCGDSLLASSRCAGPRCRTGERRATGYELLGHSVFLDARGPTALRYVLVDAAASFDVAWLEAGDEALVRLPQAYRRTSELEYDYRSPASDYHVTITLAPSGFAAVYPGLWEIEA
jgi:hypothetical protein